MDPSGTEMRGVSKIPRSLKHPVGLFNTYLFSEAQKTIWTLNTTTPFRKTREPQIFQGKSSSFSGFS